MLIYFVILLQFDYWKSEEEMVIFNTTLAPALELLTVISLFLYSKCTYILFEIYLLEK